jgi:acetate CoA/acetoacetate CoA-transferase alpha subunit
MSANKVMPLDAAVSRVESGMSLAIGGFLGQGAPLTLIRALRDSDVTALTIYANDAGFGDAGIVELILAGKVTTLYCCHAGYTPAVTGAVESGLLELVWTPQGNLIEMLRCGGAGLGGFLTPTGVGTAVAAGKEHVSVDGKTYFWERAVRVDVGLVYAHAGDTVGNLCHRGTARNYAPIVASCADYVIAEVDHISCPGELDPERIQTCGIFVDAVVRASQGQAVPVVNDAKGGSDAHRIDS